MIHKTVFLKLTSMFLSIMLMLGVIAPLQAQASCQEPVFIGTSEGISNSTEVPNIAALLNTATTDGSATAQRINTCTEDTRYFSSLQEVLKLYFSEDLPEQRQAFLATIDTRSSKVVTNYLAAEAERAEGVSVGFVPGEVLLTLKNSARKNNEEEISVVLGYSVSSYNAVSANNTDTATVYRVSIPLEYTVAQAVEKLSENPCGSAGSTKSGL